MAFDAFNKLVNKTKEKFAFATILGDMGEFMSNPVLILTKFQQQYKFKKFVIEYNDAENYFCEITNEDGTVTRYNSTDVKNGMKQLMSGKH